MASSTSFEIGISLSAAHGDTNPDDIADVPFQLCWNMVYEPYEFRQSYRKQLKYPTTTLSKKVTTMMRSVGANVFFCVPGMQIDPLLSAIDQDSNLEIVVASHECGAAFMADGYARLSQRYGACGSIGGPGTSNLLSGMMTATAHSTPIFYVTGNAPSKFESLGCFSK